MELGVCTMHKRQNLLSSYGIPLCARVSSAFQECHVEKALRVTVMYAKTLLLSLTDLHKFGNVSQTYV